MASTDIFRRSGDGPQPRGAPPHDAAEGPARGPHQNGHDDQLTPDGTTRPGRRSPTVTYLEGRERVLGRRLVLHHEPAIAAALLTEELGPLGARAWARALLEEVGR